MKRKFIILTSFLLLGIVLMAQPKELRKKNQGNPEMVQSLKIAYLTKELGLSSAEAEKFWPIYNSYVEDIKQARLTKKEDILGVEEEILNIRKKYKNDFRKSLNNSDERLNKLLNADKNFNNMLRSELQQRKKMQNIKKPGNN